jgi:hypothetical protein
MRDIIAESEHVLISPIGIQFKHNFYQASSRTVIIQFFNLINHDKKNSKLILIPMKYYYNNMQSFDFWLKLLQECDENNFLPSLKHFIFFSIIYERIANRFSTFIFPIGKNTYDLINTNNKIFVFVKDPKTIHIIAQNRLSLFLEISTPNAISIYSKLVKIIELIIIILIFRFLFMEFRCLYKIYGFYRG